MTPESILEAAARVERERGLSPWRALMTVLLEAVARLQLPQAVQPGADAARTYWSTDAGDPTTLAAAKSTCWAFLETFGPGQGLAIPQGRLVRALLCVLEPGGDDEEMSMTAEWFAAMIADL
jgi:hypothetical protein